MKNYPDPYFRIIPASAEQDLFKSAIKTTILVKSGGHNKLPCFEKSSKFSIWKK
jgi:hypothetical protein